VSANGASKSSSFASDVVELEDLKVKTNMTEVVPSGNDKAKQYEEAKRMLDPLEDKKIAGQHKWLDPKNNRSTIDAVNLATEVNQEYNSILGKYRTVRENLFSNILSPLAKREDFFLGKGLLVEGEKYREKGVLFAIEQNCQKLQDTFREIPALRNLAYANVFNQMQKTDWDPNYLPEHTQITMTDGRFSLHYENKVTHEIKTAGPFDLFPWPKAEPEVKKEEVKVEKKQFNLSLEDAQKLFPKELAGILEQDQNGVWHPNFDGKKISTGSGDLAYWLTWPEARKKDPNLPLDFSNIGEPSREDVERIIGKGFMDNEELKMRAKGLIVSQYAVGHIEQSIEAGRSKFGDSWKYGYKDELAITKETRDRTSKDIEALKQSVKFKQPLKQGEVGPFQMSTSDRAVYDASSPLRTFGDADLALSNLQALANANNGVGSTSDKSYFILKRAKEEVEYMGENYGLVRVKYENVGNIRVVAFANDKNVDEKTQVFNTFLDSLKGPFGRIKNPVSVIIPKLLPAGTYEVIFKDGKTKEIVIPSLKNNKDGFQDISVTTVTRS